MEMTLIWADGQYTLNIAGAPDRDGRARSYYTTRVGDGVRLWLACALETSAVIRIVASTARYLEVFAARVAALRDRNGELTLGLWLVDDEDDT
jgi:hypothetical protein